MSGSRPDAGDACVAVAALPIASYEPSSGTDSEIVRALQRVAADLGWSRQGAGPFGAVIPPGAKVLVKPNWVLHRNQGPWGIEPLLTHASVIQAVVEGVLEGEASAVVVGDAPIQGCDFEQLLSVTGIGAWAEQLHRRDERFLGVRDFRRTKAVFRGGVRQAREELLPLEQFVLFDLGTESLLEPVTDGRGSFRVTQYDPAQLVRTHGPGRHQYLVARDTIDANVIINLPKLKTHMKAGITCALKNLIGINGNKEYLPHHRVGGSRSGGDCYPGGSRVKRSLESAYDRLNQTRSGVLQRGWTMWARLLRRVAHATGDRVGVEGSWSGNDTIWRTCLDLNRVLLYGRADGTLADVPQRQVLNVVDAVVAGHGNGPLAPQPLPLGLMMAGRNSAAVDWISARLLGYDPSRIPIAREAFGRFRWPLAGFEPGGVQIVGGLGEGPGDEQLETWDPPEGVRYPAGWRDAVASAVASQSTGR